MNETCCGPIKDSGASITSKATYWYTLNAFPKLGRAPALEEIARDFFFQRDEILLILDSLVSQGLLRIEPTSYMILDAYPYSGVPTRHRVYFDDGMSAYCMCAIDTFYVPFLTGRDVIIRSRCYHCRAEIEIRIKQCQIVDAKPSRAITIWKSTAEYDCPMTNFFCSKDHLGEWRKKASEEPGQPCDLVEALAHGRKTVESMHKSKAGLSEILGARSDELVCYCREVPKATIVAAIKRGASSVKEIAEITTACTGGWCEETNPKKRCCCIDLEALLEVYRRI
jgi:hypothetical protein